ncbi:SDR family oxidoreductase [Deinococcus marmoris]|uniref:Oxidoreductase, short-chain dehydrogenase/reductase family n=1 Tax=Deinococcus marmoris TaxID=249408 RepID=A0A1U7NT80_9DEIO|nr:SDR family oxidoreductase [Deinococcus marmoris]OLV16129.1 Oxidoreductase, short-chain dehydrogenase/reductase family [Deinococcus marmoris]
MQTTGNTILITGGNSGIGQALAAAFHGLGNTVIITGRNQKTLDETVAAHPGMKAVVLNVDDADDIGRVAVKLVQDHPALNAVIHNAGIMQEEDLKMGEADTAEAHITTNLLGPIRLNSALLPHLLQQPKAAVLTVSSGLAFVPLSLNPTYSATKAAIHSYTQAMRYQLQGTNVQVIELVPPYVQTMLQGERQANDPNAMPLDDYIAETMQILTTQPDIREVLVERVHAQRFAERRGEHDAFFKRMNDMFTATRKP